MSEQQLRRYVLTKIEPGDYLLPSNDGRTLWRIKRSEEIEPVERGGHTTMRRVPVWEAWRYMGIVAPHVDRRLPDDFLEWSEWEACASWCATRADAIREAMRMSARAT